jgi:hypothetical protein
MVSINRKQRTATGAVGRTAAAVLLLATTVIAAVLFSVLGLITAVMLLTAVRGHFPLNSRSVGSTRVIRAYRNKAK